ncbi:MAG: LacI family DNA-binding transcriptional regulator [Caldilineales bacterium]|nr:LacI family DNA-binding transcriptional regulator [Caldilineales bacterium]
MPTIRDVATRAGVHPSTVSRVFTGKTQISEVTRVRVLAAADALGFQPNAVARSLSMQRTNMIAVVVPHAFDGYFEDSYFPEVMRGVLRSAYKHEYRVLVGGSSGRADEIVQLFDIVGSRQADGILVLSNRLDVDIVGALCNQNIPFVLMGKPTPEYEEVAWVDSNDAAYTGQVVDYLIGLGHRRIAYVGGDPDVLVTKERQRGYCEAMARAGIEIVPEWIDYGFFVEDGGYQAVQRMRRLNGDAPTAYYAANDLMALGILRALREQGIDVPGEISVVGTNGSLISAHSHPPLTTLHVPYADMTAKATSILLQSIHTGDMPKAQHTIDCQLIIRESTGPAITM